MANTYLTRTVSSASNRRTWTWSAWVKLGALSGNQSFFTSRSDNANYSTIRIEPDRFHIFDLVSSGFNYQVKTNRRLRDPNSWYHLVVAFDTTQATASNRIKLYVNGEQETSLAESSYPAQNYEGFINRNRDHYIGQGGNQGDRFDGSMSHFHLCDGTALAPTVFGSTDSTTGEWKINTSPSFTPGTNGFTILKDGNTITDQSANSNNWSLGGGTLTKTEDCPSNVFATMNPLVGSNLLGSTVNFNSGNTDVKDPNGSASGINPQFISTLAMPSKGKFYCEVQPLAFSTNSGHGIGIFRTSSGNTADATNSNNLIRYIYADTSIYITKYGSSIQTGLTAISANDIVGMALDLDNGTLQYYVNGVARGSQITGVSSANDGYDYFFHANLESSSSGRYGRYYWNFGNGYFSTTAVSSAGTNASGNGIFEYDVPANFTALSTKGLNL